MEEHEQQQQQQQTTRLGPEGDQSDCASPKRDRAIVRQSVVGTLEAPLAAAENRKNPAAPMTAGGGCDAELAKDISKIALQRLRYSGAARRKYKKAKEAAAMAGAMAASHYRRQPEPRNHRGLRVTGGGEATRRQDDNRPRQTGRISEATAGVQGDTAEPPETTQEAEGRGTV